MSKYATGGMVTPRSSEKGVTGCAPDDKPTLKSRAGVEHKPAK